MRPEVFAVALGALYFGHRVGDIWIQTHHQACVKAQPGRAGQVACLKHVITLTLTMVAALASAAAVTGLRLSVPAAAVALVLNGITHYAADRRRPLELLARLVRKGDFYSLGAPRPGKDDNVTLGTGAFELDQAFHLAFIFIAAIVITV